MAEWDRLEDENNLWYDRFEKFLMLGPRRSILAVYNAERALKKKEAAKSYPSGWGRKAEDDRWRERAEAWDEAERLRGRAEYEAERLRRRERRQDLLDIGFTKLKMMLKNLDTNKTSAAQLSMLINALYANERAEFDDDPATRLRLEGEDGQPLNVIINIERVDKPHE